MIPAPGSRPPPFFLWAGYLLVAQVWFEFLDIRLTTLVVFGYNYYLDNSYWVSDPVWWGEPGIWREENRQTWGALCQCGSSRGYLTNASPCWHGVVGVTRSWTFCSTHLPGHCRALPFHQDRQPGSLSTPLTVLFSVSCSTSSSEESQIY